MPRFLLWLLVPFWVAPPALANQVTVFAAASTAPLMQALTEAYGERFGERVRLSVAASSALARQIESGAPADIFLSANQSWMDRLEQRGLIAADTRRDLVANRLALIAPADVGMSKVAIGPGFDLSGLLGDGRLAMADPDHVPVGIYGKAALTALGVWQTVAPRVARLSDARAVVAVVGRGEAPLGIAYTTDGRTASNVGVVATFPADTHPPIVYPIAEVTGGRREAAGRFLDFLALDESRAAMRQFGFQPIP